MLTMDIKINSSLPSPLREEKSFLKGLFCFYRYSQTTSKSQNFIYFNHRGSGGFDMSNSLAAVHPELIAEWSDRNLPLTPDSVTFGSNKKVCSLYLYTFIMGFGSQVDFQAADEYNKCQWRFAGFHSRAYII